jgi:hypothetical protein
MDATFKFCIIKAKTPLLITVSFDNFVVLINYDITKVVSNVFKAGSINWTSPIWIMTLNVQFCKGFLNSIGSFN